MATERQVEANRQNARSSTGPTSDEGKEVSRANALKHGFAGAGVVLPPDEAEEVERRTAEWMSVIRPVSTVEAFHVAQYALESVRVERCQAQERILLRRLAREAGDPGRWAVSRQMAVASVVARLPRQPARSAAVLRSSVCGCDWLIERWCDLSRALGRGPWNEALRSLALDLIGFPLALRDGPTPADPGPDDEAAAPQAALARAQLDELTRLRNGVLREREDDDRDAAAAGVDDGETPTARALRLVRRYESACQRRMERTLRLLLTGRLIDRTCGRPVVAFDDEGDRPESEPGTADSPEEPALDDGPTEEDAPAETASRPTSRPAALPSSPCWSGVLAYRPETRIAGGPVPRPPVSPAASAPAEPAPDVGPAPEPRKGNRRWRRQQARRERQASRA